MRKAKLKKHLANYGSAVIMAVTVAALVFLYGPWAGTIAAAGMLGATSALASGISDVARMAARVGLLRAHEMDRDKFNEYTRLIDGAFTGVDYTGAPIVAMRYDALKVAMSDYLNAATQGFPKEEGGEAECPSDTESATQ